jgi:hypothetical protein
MSGWNFAPSPLNQAGAQIAVFLDCVLFSAERTGELDRGFSGRTSYSSIQIWGFVLWSKSEQSPFSPKSYRTNAVDPYCLAPADGFPSGRA